MDESIRNGELASDHRWFRYHKNHSLNEIALLDRITLVTGGNQTNEMADQSRCAVRGDEFDEWRSPIFSVRYEKCDDRHYPSAG